MPIDHFPAFPAVEHQQQDGEEGNPKSQGKTPAAAPNLYRMNQLMSTSTTATRLPQMLPGITDVANTSVTDKIDKAEKRCDERHDNAGPEKPHRSGCPNRITAPPENEVSHKRCDQKNHRKMESASGGWGVQQCWPCSLDWYRSWRRRLLEQPKVTPDILLSGLHISLLTKQPSEVRVHFLSPIVITTSDIR
jgi:hypothetical protein